MALVGVELETLVFEPDAQTTRPPPCVSTITVNVLLFTAKYVLAFLIQLFNLSQICSLSYLFYNTRCTI